MESHNGAGVPPEHASQHSPQHHHGIKPIDSDYRLVVRTILWIIAGLVFLGFVIWWSLT
jgi:hypothetical protein